MIMLTLVGSFAAFWGFFGWFFQHKTTVLGWLVLGYGLVSLYYFYRILQGQALDLFDPLLSVTIGALALRLCYKR